MTDKKKPTREPLPAPKKLTAEDLRRADEEASRWREAVELGTEQLEKISVENLQIRLR